MTRIEIRRRALRAAAAVSLTASLLGCGGVVVVDADDPAAEPEPDRTPAPLPVEIPAAPDGPVDAPDALDDALAAPVVDPGTEDCGPLQETDYDAWLACCEANGWDWNKGCEAWGPPVPPAMGVA